MSNARNLSDLFNSSGDLTVDTNTLHVDAANNRVGVGTTSPASSVNVVDTSSTANVRLESGSGTPVILQTFASTSAGGAFVDVNSDHPLVFRTNATERARVTNNGLTFNGDTAAANALDDYEEGTWTPTVSVGTISHIGSRYVKIGQMVTVMSNVHSVSNRTAGDHFSISGLPYDIHNTATGGTGIMGRYVNNGGDGIVLYLPLDASRMDLYTTLKGSNYTGIGHNDLNSASANFFFSVTYITDQ